MSNVRRFSTEEFLDNPIPFRRFKSARITNLSQNISEFEEGERVEIEYFCTFPNEPRGGEDMPIYKVRKLSPDGDLQHPHLLFADSLGDFSI